MYQEIGEALGRGEIKEGQIYEYRNQKAMEAGIELQCRGQKRRVGITKKTEAMKKVLKKPSSSGATKFKLDKHDNKVDLEDSSAKAKKVKEKKEVQQEKDLQEGEEEDGQDSDSEESDDGPPSEGLSEEADRLMAL